MNECNGLNVLELADGYCSTAVCGQIFVGLGANVVKVENPTGDSLRQQASAGNEENHYLFDMLHSGKQSACWESLNGDAKIADLLGWADIVISEGPLGRQMERTFGRAENGRESTVFCRIQPFDSEDILEDWRSNEFFAQALSGLMICTGYPELPPVRSRIPYATHVTALFAFQGIMAAIWERERSGAGQSIELSMVDSVISLLGNYAPSFFLTGVSPRRVGNRHPTASPWNLYPTADGHVVICTGVGGLSWWDKITRLIGRSELAGHPKYRDESLRVKYVEEVDAIVRGWTLLHSTKQVADRMSEAGIPAGEVKTIREVLSDAHYSKARSIVRWSAPNASQTNVPIAGNPLALGSSDYSLSKSPSLGAADSRVFATNMRPAQSRQNLSGHSRPLEGVRVLEFASRTSGPLAGRFLADLGADVIKIEPASGDHLRNAGQIVGGSTYLFHVNNAGKRSICADSASSVGHDAILKLVETADVWIENLAPGSLDAMGYGYEALRAVNPRLVYASCSGFGHKSHYGKRRALDTVVQAAVGMMSVTGYPDHLPCKLGISAIDLASAVALSGAIVASLRGRLISGVGVHIDLAMADVGVWMTQGLWPDAIANHSTSMRVGNRAVDQCPHGIFETKDGLVAIVAISDAHWRSLARLIGLPAQRTEVLSSVVERLKNASEIDSVIGSWTSRHNNADCVALCTASGIPVAVVRDFGQIFTDAVVIRRGMVPIVSHPQAGPIKLLGNPLQMSRSKTGVAGPAPDLGEHTEEVFGTSQLLLAPASQQ